MDKETKEQVIEYLRKLASEIESGDKNLCGFSSEMSRDKEQYLICEKCGKSESDILIESLEAENAKLKDRIKELEEELEEEICNQCKRRFDPMDCSDARDSLTDRPPLCDLNNSNSLTKAKALQGEKGE